MLLDWLHCFNSGVKCAHMSVVIWLATVSVVTFFKSGYTALLILGFPESRQSNPSLTAKKHPMLW
jgi:hypothetical protein